MDPAMVAALEAAKVVTDPSLRLHIPFNEGVGSVAKDYSQYGNNGELTDVEWGILGCVFNGTSAYVKCDDDPSLNLTGAITIEAWLKPTFTDKNCRVLYKYDPTAQDGYFLGQSPTDSGYWIFYVFVNSSTDNVISNSAPTVDWQHVVAVRESNGTMKIYIDSILQTDTGTLAGAIGNNDPLYIGQDRAGASSFNGSIDGVKIHNCALTSLETKNDFEAERGKYGV